MSLRPEERENFLAEPHVAALSVEREDGRAPLTVPIWYTYEPGGELRILTPGESVKAQLLARAGRFTMMVDRVEPTVRYVSVEGPVLSTEPASREALRDISARYLPREKLDSYVEAAWREHGRYVVIRMRPEHWLGADMGTV